MTTSKKVYHLRQTVEVPLAMAQAVAVGEVLYLGAVNSMDPTGKVQGGDDMEAQLEHAYGNFRTILEAHDAGFENVVKETIYTRDTEALFHALSHRQQIYEDIPPPAVTVVEVSRFLAPAVLVAVDAVVELPMRE
jgi:enamine deaminase RidA (YjgF/YER057c/UK114 family)